jgi:succinate dehydrogenase / fumarate reductase cytochrome b subunit
MCVEAAPKSGCKKKSCGCGGHGRHAQAATQPDPRAILAMKFGEDAEHKCGCGGATCPRHYLAITGFLLGGFLALHLAVNALGLWPDKFQAAVNRNHSLGALLPVLEVGLIFLPLTIHVAFGLRTLRREKLTFGVEKHHHGSDLRQWLQRVTALIMLAFITLHLATLQRWFGGRFDPKHAFSSASHAIWQFWHGLPAGNPGNLIFAQFYLLGIVAAVYHVTNGVATGADFWGRPSTPVAHTRLWRICLIAAPALLLAGLAAWYAFAVR